MEVIKGGPSPKKKPNLFARLLAFLLTLALVVGAVAIVAYRDRFNLDAIKRFFTYRGLERNESGQAASFKYDIGLKGDFATLDGGLLICSPTGIRLYSASGALYLDLAVGLEHPVIDASSKTALVYDVGGQDLFVFSNKEQVFSLSLEKKHVLLAASVNADGWLAVTAQETGYKGSVTVYNSAYEKVLQVNLSSSFVTDAVVSPDNKWLAIVTVGLGGGGFESRINLYRLDRTEEDTAPDYTCSVGNNVSLDLQWKNDGIWTLGENGVSCVSPDGVLTGSYSYTGRYLKRFALEGDGFAVLLLGKYRAGSSADLSVVDASGAVTATVPMSDQVLSLSAAGKYISVLTADRLDIYTQDLTLYNSLKTTQGAQRVIQRADGSVMLIGVNTARLYVPA